MTGPVRSTEDRWTLRAAEVSIAMITILGWVLSYTALRRLAEAHGYLAWEARLWPLTVDLLVLVATAIALTTARRRRGPTNEAWTLAVVAALVTVAGNMLSAGPDPVARALHAWPACCMVAAWHLFFRLVASGDSARLALAHAVREPAAVSGRSDALRAVSGADRGRASQPGPRALLQELVAVGVRRLRLKGERLTGESLARALDELGHPVSSRHAQRLLKRLAASPRDDETDQINPGSVALAGQASYGGE
ncbi:MAG: DUF2637 domain-containing protein [Candidatus Dormibacteraeota bacterium]|nr:DUF2637 domain-containing protein [Candidatus Dormibacteraeota bacterium]